ncbi:MAG: sigma-70 family RNA polymerase sigma factor [Candidatus Omnitrophota bacterium]|jgi:RNA polymerase sigma-70 factor (ECF subfamily)
MTESIQHSSGEDLDIIRHVLEGDRNAFALLVRKYQDKVRGYCTNVVGHREAAEDVSQEVFVKAFRALPSFQGRSAFSTWLYRIMANHCRDWLRKKGRQKQESWEALLEKEGDRIEALLSVAPEAAVSTENSELVAKILACLGEKHRSVIVLRELQGLSYEEMAEALETTVDGIKARLKRARREMEEKTRHLFGAAGVQSGQEEGLWTTGR